MFTRIAVACFALYCVHGAQNSARDGAALAGRGAELMREASAEAPKAALSFCLENAALCAKAIGAGDAAPVAELTPRTLPVPVEGYPLPPRRPSGQKKA
jgi:hypothetical protein